MSTSINKSGVWYADGSDINKNLILNGNIVGEPENSSRVSSMWINWSYGSDRSVESAFGMNWLHFKTGDNTKYGGFYQDNNVQNPVQVISPNTDYTVSALVFASEPTNCIFWFHLRSTEGGANISQPSKQFTTTTEPKLYSFTFNTGSNATYTINRFSLMIGYYKGVEGVDVYFTNIKLEEGSIATPWIPNESDEIYILNTQGFNEGRQIASVSKGSLNGNSFIEL